MSASKQAAELDKCTIFSKTKNPYWVLQWPWCHFRLLQLCTNNLKPILLLLVSKQLIAMHKCNTDGTQKQHNVIWGPSQYITEEGPISPANTAEWLVSTLRIIFNINPLLCWCSEGFFFIGVYVAISQDTSWTSPFGRVLCISSWEENRRQTQEMLEGLQLPSRPA